MEISITRKGGRSIRKGGGSGGDVVVVVHVFLFLAADEWQQQCFSYGNTWFYFFSLLFLWSMEAQF